MRTTHAVHTLFATKDAELVKVRLGHKTLQMAVEHYNRHTLDAKGQAPGRYYRIPERLTLDGYNVFTEDSPFDRYILFLTLNQLKRDLAAEDWAKAKRWCLHEAGHIEVLNTNPVEVNL